MRRTFLVLLLVIVTFSLLVAQDCAQAQSFHSSDELLAERFAPVLYFHPAELFRPQPVDRFIDAARLREERYFWMDINLMNHVSIADLVSYRTGQFFLDLWYGSELSSDNKNYTAHREYYQANFTTQAGGPPVTAYAHINRSETSEYIILQYWLFYYYNDWFNKHEGDWEMVEVILDAQEKPVWLVLSQHHGGTRRAWENARVEEGTHPAVYVALGSHANYFYGNEAYPNGMDIGSARIEILDHTGSTGRVIPAIQLLPDTAEVEEDAAAWASMDWLLFGGHWGETAQQGDFGGPTGPAYKGDQWDRPYAWGISQPLDSDTWYRQRLEVRLEGGGEIMGVQSDDQKLLSALEMNTQKIIFHQDPQPETILTVDVQSVPETPASMVVSVPDLTGSQVTRYRYDLPSGSMTVTLTLGTIPAFGNQAGPFELTPTVVEQETFQWNNADLVWLPGLLPAGDVLKGLLVCLLAGWLPALVFTALFYWIDRYEKEPFSLLVTSFLWGALPALLISVVLRLFVRLPLDLLGSNAIRTVGSGIASPLIEETLKGAVILFIALRYRREFDDVLDGIIYGGLVGIGFAMNANIISYLGSFLTRGFAGLENTFLSQGVVYGLNHALYSAIFGAGLGQARLAVRRYERWFVPVLAFTAAVSTHALHNLILNSVRGWNVATIMITLAGLLVLVAAVVVVAGRQHRCLQSELADVLPCHLFQTVTSSRRKLSVEWLALLHNGFRAWRKVRHFHQLCAEFAFKRMQSRLFPEEKKISAEMHRLQDEIRAELLNRS